MSDEMKCSVSGELIAYEQEGGYCAPYFAVYDDTDETTTSVQGMVECLLPDVLDSPGGGKGVQVRFTFELIDPKTDERPLDDGAASPNSLVLDALAWAEFDGDFMDRKLESRLVDAGRWGSAGENACEILAAHVRRLTKS